MWALVFAGQVKYVSSSPTALLRERDVYYQDGIHYSPNVFQAWTKDEIRAIGYYPVRTTATPPDPIFYHLAEVFTIEVDHVLRDFDATPKDVSDVRRNLRGQVKQLAAGARVRGFEYVSPNDGLTYVVETDSKSYADLIAVYAFVSKVGALPPAWPSVWIDRDDKAIPVPTNNDLTHLAETVITHMVGVFVNERDHKKEIQIKNFDALKAHNIKSGWPAKPTP